MLSIRSLAAPVAAALLAVALTGRVHAQSSKAKAPKQPKQPTEDQAVQMACVERAVNTAVNTVQNHYWPPDPKNPADDPRRQKFSGDAMATLNKSKAFNRALGKLCHDLQVAAKKAASSKP